MKKLLALLLAAAMCLSLVACGSEEMPDAGTHNDPQPNDHQVGNQYADHPLLQVLYGEWKLQDEKMGDNLYAHLIVKDDGTCFIDEKNGTWEISEDTHETKLEIHIYMDGEYFAGACIRGLDNPGFFGLIDRGNTVAGTWEKVG